MDMKRKVVLFPPKLEAEAMEMCADMERDFSEVVREAIREKILTWRSTRQRLYPEPKATQGYAGRPVKPEIEKQIDKMIQEADAGFLKMRELNPNWPRIESVFRLYEEVKARRDHDALKVFNQETRSALAADASSPSAFAVLEESIQLAIEAAYSEANCES